LATLIVDDLRC